MRKLKHHRNEIVTAAPVLHELLFGCFRMPHSEKRKMLEIFIKDIVANMDILPYENRAAEYHAGERSRLVSAGRTPSFTDGLIAAITKVNGLILVTRNVKDFEGFSGLKIDDWQG
jgi:tRNA(fMet)-specific endonuclease VapC